MGSYTYSVTAASNTSIDGIGAQGSDSPDNIDNLVRALAASQAALVRDLGGASTSVGGTADAITVSLADPTAATAYFDGMIFAFRVATDSTSTAPTLNVDGIGAKTIKRTIQGVESALIAGDLQAGQTAIVVYRSAWATAAGAFELLNPSIESRIELGHATDTTLSRSAAGVLAVEGNVVPSPSSQAQYDMLVRGASSWDRLAIGTNGQVQKVVAGAPAWSNVSTFDTVKASTSGSEVDFTGIPSWVKEIDIMLDGVSLSGSDNLLFQLGDSGGIETSGYTNTYGIVINGASSAVSTGSTSGFNIDFNAAGSTMTGILQLKNITGNVWIASGTFAKQGSAQMLVVAGTKTLSATLDRVRVDTTGTNTFDAGQINICYR